jgi:hypothetical protein
MSQDAEMFLKAPGAESRLTEAAIRLDLTAGCFFAKTVTKK